MYGAFVKTAFLNILAYRLRYYTGIITYTLFVGVHYCIWNAVYSGRGGVSLQGFTLSEMVTYIAVGWIARSCYFSTIDEDIDDVVRSGQVSLLLLRPVNFHLMMLAQAFGESLFRILFFTVPIGLLVTYLFEVQLPQNGQAAMLFLFFSAGSFLILAEINFLVGLTAFRIQSIQGITRAKYAIVQLCSGLLLPLSFFPGWAAGILRYLPFRLMTAVPMQCYLGKVSFVDARQLGLELAAWCLFLGGASEFLWRRELRNISIQGG